VGSQTTHFDCYKKELNLKIISHFKNKDSKGLEISNNVKSFVVSKFNVKTYYVINLILELKSVLR
jgi:hypothetical protein